MSDHVDVYDPAQQMWFDGTPLPADAPRHHLAVALSGNTIYVLGGFVGIIGGMQNFAPVAATFSFDGTRGPGSPINRSRAARRQHRRSTARSTSPAAGNSSPMRCPISTPMIPPPTAGPRASDADRARARRLVRARRQARAVGGWLNDKTVVGAAEAYDPVAASWSILPDLPTPRGGLAANVLGTVCDVVGGEQWIGPDPGTFADNQGFDFAVGEWRPFAPMTHRRHGLGFAALDGSLWTIGGGPSRGNSYTNVVDVFTPGS